MIDPQMSPFGPPIDPTTTPVRLYAGPSLWEDDKEIPLTPQQAAFLTVVAIHGGAGVSRGRVAWLMWEEEAEEPARRRISQLLYSLKQRSDVAPVIADGDYLKPNPDLPSDLDRLRLCKALKPVSGKPLGRLTGPFETGSFEKWVTTQRTTLRYLAIERNGELLAVAEGNHDYELVAESAKALLEFDPVNERALRSLIRALALGRSALQAEAAYRHQVEIVERILPDWAPSRETRRLLGEIDTLKVKQAAEQPRGFDPHGVRLVGRKAELSRLREYALGPGPPYQDVMIMADPGIGKSRLLEELGRQLALDDCRLVRVRSFAAEEGIAFNLLSHIARSEPFQEAIRNVAPLWRQVLSLSLDIEPVDVPDVDLPELPPDAASRRAYDAFRHLFDAVEGRVVILADGFGGADSSSLAALSYLRRRVTGSTIRFIGTVVRDALRRTDSQARYLRDLLEDVHDRVDLEPLSEEESAELLQAARGGPIGHKQTTELVRLAGGNPLFLIELAQGEEGGIPASLKGLLEKRVSSLTDSARTLLGVLSAQTGPTSLQLLADIAELSVSDVLMGIDDALSRRLLTTRDGRVAFQHGIFKEWVYRNLTEPQRTFIHTETRSRLESGPNEPAAADLAHHCLAAGHKQDAYEWAERGLEVAVAQAAIPHAIEFFLILSNCAPTDAQAAGSLGEAGRLLYLQGQTDEALDALERSILLSGDGESRFLIQTLHARAALETGQSDAPEVIARLEEIRDAALNLGEHDSALEALDSLMVVANEHLEYSKVRSTLDLISATSWSDSPAVRCRLALLRSFHFLYGDRHSGVRATDLAVKLAKEFNLEELFTTALARNIIAHLWEGDLNVGEVRDLLSLAKDASLQTGDRRQLFRAFVNLSTWFIDVLDGDHALHVLSDCDGVIEDADPPLRAYLDLNWAEYWLLRRDYDKAGRLFRDVSHVAVSVRPDIYPNALAGWGFCELNVGRLARAREIEEAVLSTHAMDGELTNADLTLVFRFLARLEEVRGRWKRGDEILERGLRQTDGVYIPGWLRLVIWKQELRRKHRERAERHLIERAMELASNADMPRITYRLNALSR